MPTVPPRDDNPRRHFDEPGANTSDALEQRLESWRPVVVVLGTRPCLWRIHSTTWIGVVVRHDVVDVEPLLRPSGLT